MHTLPKIFFRWAPTILYSTICPVFYFVFVLMYEPLGLPEYFDMGKGLFSQNLAITLCISLFIITGTRLLFRLMRNVPHFTWSHYVCWSLGEVLLVGVFEALYLHLVSGEQTFFSVLMKSVGFCYMIFLIPYLILTLSFTIGSHKEREKEIAAKENADDSLIRFLDLYQRPKLIIASSAVLYIEAKENYVIIHYSEGERIKQFELRATMASLEAIASKYGFVRCQRSFYVNPVHVTVLRKETGGLVYADLDVAGLPSIPVSKRYSEDLAKML